MIDFEARSTSLKYGKPYDHGVNLLLLIKYYIARYIHVTLCGLSDLDSGGCLIIIIKYINSHRYIS
jgi:hypothetical protein